MENLGVILAEACGARDHRDGLPRTPPSYATNDLTEAWLRAWDRAEKIEAAELEQFHRALDAD